MSEVSELDLEATEDGSLSVRDRVTGELFHNRAGAYTEAVKNYLEPSLAIEKLKASGSIRLLDVCFGLGYNSLVLMEAALLNDIAGTVSIIAVEQDRAVIALWRSMLNDARFALLKQRCGDTISEHGLSYSNGAINISLEIIPSDFRKVITGLPSNFDLVFHDPFSPRHVPQLWSIDIFEHYRRLLQPSGSVLTYSSAVAVRSSMQMCGFRIFRTASVGGKSGGTIGTLDTNLSVDNSGLFELSTQEEDRLKTSSAVPYRDSSLDGDAATVLKTRQREQLQRRALL